MGGSARGRAGRRLQGGLRQCPGELVGAWRKSRRVQETRLREIDLLRFQTAELAKAGLSVEEEKSLLGEQRLLSRAEEILRSAGASAHALRNDGDEPDAGMLVAQAGAQLAGLVGVDETLDSIIAAVSDVQHQVTEVARDLHAYLESIAVDPARLQVVDDRLRLYTDLVRKYGGSTGAAVAYLAQATERLATLENVEEDLVRLEEARAAQAARALELAATLTEERRKAAPLLEQAVGAQLADLGMVSAALRVDLSSHSGMGRAAADRRGLRGIPPGGQSWPTASQSEPHRLRRRAVSRASRYQMRPRRRRREGDPGLR